MSECTVLELREKLTRPDTTLIDVREFPEYASGRVPRAKLIPLGELTTRHKEIDQNQTVFVICHSGKRSSQAQTKLKALGYLNVINVTGGTETWRQQDLPIEKDENAVWDLERQVRFTAGTIVLIGLLLATFVDRYFILISGFVGAGLVFSALTNTCTMGLLLAKMPWNRSNRLKGKTV